VGFDAVSLRFSSFLRTAFKRTISGPDFQSGRPEPLKGQVSCRRRASPTHTVFGAFGWRSER
jgi:hypothetical protein